MAGTASAAGAAIGAAAAAGGLACFFIPDHRAQQQRHHQGDDQDEDYIDQIGREPREHGITSFQRAQNNCGGTGGGCLQHPVPPQEGERDSLQNRDSEFIS